MKLVSPTRLLMASTAVALGALALAAAPAFASPNPLTVVHTPVLRVLHAPLPKPGPAPSTILYADGGPAHVYVTGYGFGRNETVTLTVLTSCIVGGIPDVCDDIGREKVQANGNGDFTFLFHATGDSNWVANLASYTGVVWVAADAPSLEDPSDNSAGTLWSQATIAPPPQFFGTYQEACSFPVLTSASGWTPGDTVQFELWAQNGTQLDSTTATADPNTAVAQASLETHGYVGPAFVEADEMGNPYDGPLAPDAEIRYPLNLC